DLASGDAGTARQLHGVEQVLHERGGRVTGGVDRRGALSQHRVAEDPDLAHAHAGATTTIRSPACTGVVPGSARRSTVPAIGVVIAASIFIASMVATASPAATVSPSATLTVTAPANGAATWPGTDASAFSTCGLSTFT